MPVSYPRIARADGLLFAAEGGDRIEVRGPEGGPETGRPGHEREHAGTRHEDRRVALAGARAHEQPDPDEHADQTKPEPERQLPQGASHDEPRNLTRTRPECEAQPHLVCARGNGMRRYRVQTHPPPGERGARG